MSSASAELTTGMRNNAATEAAINSTDPAREDLSQMATPDHRIGLWQARVAEENRMRMQHSGIPLQASAADVMQVLEHQNQTHNGLVNTPRVQLPYGMTLKNTTSAEEPQLYAQMLKDFRKLVCLQLHVPSSLFDDRGMGTVSGDVAVMELFERGNIASIKTMAELFTFFWSHLQQASHNLMALTRDANSGTEEEEEEEEVKEEREVGRKRKRGSTDKEVKKKKAPECEARVLLRYNPRPELLLNLWEREMLDWEFLRAELSQITCLPEEAFVKKLKPVTQRDFEIREEDQKNQVRQHNQEMKQRSMQQAQQQQARITHPGD